jgi:hypothetical protein
LKGKRLAPAAFLAAGALTVGGFALSSPSAFANSSNGATHVTTHCDPSDPACQLNPALTGPPPPFVTIAPNCPSFISTDSWTLDFVSGNSVSHGTDNKNGSWGGGTAEGQAVFTTSDGTVQYTGHLQEWFGGGQNTPDGSSQVGQGENGFTTNFNGSGVAGKLSIHASGHMTFNNSGRLTANTTNAQVTCS